MIMIVISFALVKFYAFAILYVLIVMQIKLVVVDMFIKQSTRYSLRSTSTNNHFIPRPRCEYLKKSCSYRGAY